MTQPLLYDSHMHTPLCKHARGEPEEYAAQAEKRGLKGIIITCHNPGPDGWSSNVRMSREQFGEYVDMVARARQAWAGRIDVRLGLESDYFPGMESYLEELHQLAEFNHILGSVHPQLDYYKEAFWNNDPLAFQETYFQHLADAAETGLFDTISHPDLVKNSFPKEWDPRHMLSPMKRSLDRIARSGTAMELNTSGLHKAVREMNPNRHMLTAMRTRSIPVVLGSDAHSPKRVAADFNAALDLLEDVGFTHVSYFIDRQRQDVPIATAQASLAP